MRREILVKKRFSEVDLSNETFQPIRLISVEPPCRRPPDDLPRGQAGASAAVAVSFLPKEAFFGGLR